MTGRVVPHDSDAERSLLGAMMLAPDALAAGVDTVTTEDFYHPNHALIFAALVGMYRRGEPCDSITVSDELGRMGALDQIGGLMALESMRYDCPSTGNARRYAAILARHSLSRHVIRLASEVTAEAYEPGVDPYELVEQAQARLGGLQTAGVEAPKDVTTWDAFLDRPIEIHKPWVIPGMIRIGWRVVVVAAESRGKTMLTTAIALCAGQGVHPFTGTPIDPIRTLFVDLENPDEHVDLRGNLIRRPLRMTRGDLYQTDQTWLWHRPGGLNVRSRPGRSALEAAIAHVRPQLVVIAPVYKMFRATAKETDEMAAGEVQDVLDNLRTRYDFALILEHHAPKGVSRARDMVPFGSALWLRWPESGLALMEIEKTPGALKVGRYKPDRLPCRWPDELHRGTVWPWDGYYEGGLPQDQMEEAF